MTAPPLALFDLAEAVGRWVMWAVVSVFNLLIAGIGAALQAILSLLPDMPDPPAQPAGDWIGWLNWFAPVAEILAAASVMLGIWVVFLLLKVGLNWVKAL
jgi:uncharacterized membrane protein